MPLSEKLVNLTIYRWVLVRLVKDIEPHFGNEGVDICLNAARALDVIEKLIRELRRDVGNELNEMLYRATGE